MRERDAKSALKKTDRKGLALKMIAVMIVVLFLGVSFLTIMTQ